MRNPRSGFTLVELVVSFVILTVGIVAILELVGQSALNARYAKDKTTATVLAQQKLEEITMQPDSYLGEVEGNFGNQYPQFRWRAQVSEVTTNTQSSMTNVQSQTLWQITVIVEWRDRGRLESVELDTLQSSVPVLHPQEATALTTTASTEGMPSDMMGQPFTLGTTPVEGMRR